MKINAIRFNNKKSVMTGQESELKALILFSALFACGMIIGAGIFNADIGTTNFIKNILNDMFLINESGAAANVLLNSLIINIGLLIFLVFMGLNCTGIPVIIVSIFMKGVGFGIIAGYLFCEFSLSGIGYYLMIIMPAGILLCTSFIISGIYSYFMAFDLIRILYGRKSAEKKLIVDYCIKMMPCVIVTIIASLLGVFLRTAFSGLFDLI